MEKTQIHTDNTVTYYDVYAQCVRRRVDARAVSAESLSSLPMRDRDRIIAAQACAEQQDED